jgi:3D (Asp-Asp-Asp) domain-containing protein
VTFLANTISVIRSLPGRLKNVRFYKKRADRKHPFFKSHKLAPLTMFLCVSVLLITATIANMKYVRVVDKTDVKNVITFRSDPKAILKQCGITLSTSDEYSFSGFQGNRASINLYIAFPVTIQYENQSKKVLIARGNVAAAIKKAGFPVDNDDIVNVPMNNPVSKDMNIVVTSVSYQTISEKQVINCQLISEQTNLLKKGQTSVAVSGKSGEKAITYRLKYVGGVLREKKQVSEMVDVQPVNRKILVGTKSENTVKAPVASDDNNTTGVSVNCKKVIQAVATAYTAKSGSGTASGRNVQFGNVAVNPNVIPYGTRLYIADTAGSFVYGYAVAADTGGFVTDGSGVGVDLFFDTLNECNQFGKRSVNIYVL